ncbi:MAG: DUF5606 domain-containing protein [Flavipsychrobacter sp.]|nr:DUF5606 domain-containing protein [Flavipsychrobacter sp.]
MEYREIVAVTGIGGLFQLVATKADGAIVRNLADKTTKFISARLHNVTPLESIEVYTTGDNVRLHEVFEMMKNDSTPVADPKKTDDKGIKAYFKGIFPAFDEDRVYVSDMKKMLKWFELLKANDLLNFDAYKPQEEGEEATAAEEVKEEAPAKKAVKKKAAEADTTDGEAKPAKKAAKKKKAEDPAELFAEGDAATEKPAKKAAAKKKKTEE